MSTTKKKTALAQSSSSSSFSCDDFLLDMSLTVQHAVAISRTKNKTNSIPLPLATWISLLFSSLRHDDVFQWQNCARIWQTRRGVDRDESIRIFCLKRRQGRQWPKKKLHGRCISLCCCTALLITVANRQTDRRTRLAASDETRFAFLFKST